MPTPVNYQGTDPNLQLPTTGPVAENPPISLGDLAKAVGLATVAPFAGAYGAIAMSHPDVNPVAAAAFGGTEQPPALPPPVPAAAPGTVPGLPPQLPAPATGAAPVAARTGSGGLPVADFDKQIQQQQQKIQAASGELQTAIQEGATAEKQANQDVSTQRLANKVELADKQKEIHEVNRQLDLDDAANLKQAKEATIPAFWAGREGARVGAVISVALAGIGAGLLGSTNNQALTAIQHGIDQYFMQEKDRIDNLYKYAEQQGKFNAQTRLMYAQELLNLKDQHSYVIEAAKDRVSAVAAQARGAVDAKKQAFLEAQLGEQAIKDRMDVRELRGKLHLMSSQANAADASARESDARAKQGGFTSMQSIVFDAAGRPVQLAQSPQAAGEFRKAQDSIAALGQAIDELDKSYDEGVVLPGGLTQASRRRAAAMSKVVLAAKDVGKLGVLAGPDLQLVEDLAGGRLGNILGSKDGIQNLRGLRDIGLKTALSQVGIQPTPENMARFNPGTAAAPVPQSVPPGLPPGTTSAGKTKDGRNAWRLPDGKLVAE